MRDIKRHIIHCSATPNLEKFTVEDCREMHLARGWSDIGYHFMIYPDGTIHNGRPCEIMGAHTKGYNADSIGTCLVGTDKFTVAQLQALLKLDKDLKHLYNKNMTAHGHNEFTNLKTCPNFNVQAFFEFANETINI